MTSLERFLLWLSSSGVVALVLFLSAGRMDIPVFWVYIAILAAFSLLALLSADPMLIRERLRPPGGTDRQLVFLGRLGVLTHLAIVGLDVGRYYWSRVPPGLQAAAFLVFGAGLALGTWATSVNPFFSSVIRLQSERGHHLVTGGPYRYVRHPGYLGGILIASSSGLALGSWWSLVPAVLGALLIIRRTVLEERFLYTALEGYSEYAKDVRYRVLPGVW